MNSIQQWVWILLIVVGLGSAKAEGFSVGAAAGLTTLLDARVTYEADAFGLRAYATVLATLGLDVYVRLGDPAGLGYRLGVGLWDFWATSTPFLGWRALLGLTYAFTPELNLVAEIRPMFPFDIPKNVGEEALSVYLSMLNIGFEYKFNF